MTSAYDIDARFAAAHVAVHALCAKGDRDAAQRLVRTLSESLIAGADGRDAPWIAFQAESLRTAFHLEP